MKKNKDMDKGMQQVLVDAAMLGQGLKTTFLGVAMIFDSLGAADAGTEINAEIAGAVKDIGGEKMPSAKEDTVSAGSDAKGQSTVTEKTDTSSASSPSEEDKPPFETEDTLNQSGTTTVTVDDITKVIVAKIKQKRSNNEKIGSLLMTYGVEKVSGLPAEKYEAFLNDISQL